MPYFILKTVIITLLIGCTSIYYNKESLIGYNLEQPDKFLVLPDTLREISGLAEIDSVTFACVQDENGILFIYDLVKNQIKSQYTFNIDGDYEGITRIGETMYILRSDGVLFEIVNYTSKTFELNSYETKIPSDNNEGLCYDAENNCLLIASKGKVGKGGEFKDLRVIYSFDLTTKQLSEEPVYEFDVKDIKDFAIENKVDLPTKTRMKKGEEVTEPALKFRPSAIAIHPITKKLYLLSAADHLLFIFNQDETLEHIEVLNPKVFNKSEGITFLKNGDMLITNEGQGGAPTLLRFDYNF